MARRDDDKSKGRQTRRTTGTKRPGGGRSTSRRAPRASGRGQPRKKSKQKRGLTLGRALRWLIVLGVWCAVGLGGLLAYYAYDLPDVSRMAVLERQPAVTLLAKDGSILAASGQLTGEALRVEELPPHLPQAVLAIEDRRFYEHPGLDVLGLARAMLTNLQAGRLVQGGSTISQQLAKNLFLSPERSLKRKVQELMLAFWLERKFSKDQILTLYLNRVYLGASAYGVDAAARRYFGKSATEVTLYESAMLAGLLKAPSRLSPTSDAGAADARTKVVLNAMVEAGFITQTEAVEAYKNKSRKLSRQSLRARYFTDWVIGEVRNFVGFPDRDLIVQTTLDPRLQGLAERAVESALKGASGDRGVQQAALVSLTPDGAVRAMVGGRDYQESQFNRATQALRQPGSAFKTFVFLAAFEKGWHPDAQILDAPVTIGKWSPENYDERYRGEITLREAYALSLNTATVRLSQAVGVRNVAAQAQKMGITTPLTNDASLALGTSEVTLIELTGAYAALANNGFGAWAYGIVEVRDTNGHVLFRHDEQPTERLIDEQALAKAADVMRATVEWGTGKAARIDRPVAGKTGTSQDFRDAWFIGYTRDLVTGVWFGNDDGKPMKRVSGGSLPATTWAAFMKPASEGAPGGALPGSEIAIAPSAPSAQNDQSGDSSVGGFIGRLLQDLRGGSAGSKSSNNSGSNVSRENKTFGKTPDR